jgi:prevent-host-death family protein
MEDTISAADANRNFSRLLRAVRAGRRITVTSHGRPVARLVPVGEQEESVAQQARHALLTRLRGQRPMNVGRWTRAELYER